jgi:hypothetical protein
MSRYGYFPTPFFAAKLEKIKKHERTGLPEKSLIGRLPGPAFSRGCPEKGGI